MATAATQLNPTEATPPAVNTNVPAPVRTINTDTLKALGQELNQLFCRYASDRQLTELKWLQNLRQYLGIYDPEIEAQLAPNRSKAYPRVTRVKCISVLSRLMNLMFPGNERNWELSASPSPEMSPEDIKAAVEELIADRDKDGLSTEMSMEIIDAAVQRLADRRAAELSNLIDDQLQELGGDQTLDYILLNRKVIDSGIKFGLGVLEGPYVRKEQQCGWVLGEGGNFEPHMTTCYKPQFDFTPVWDFYPDMSARVLPGEGYFIRKVMGRSTLRKLANRPDFFGEEIKKYLRTNQGRGNYQARNFETQLRTMGTKANVSDTPTDPQGKYEIIVWKGPISAGKLMELGVTVPEKYQADDVDSEIWLVDGNVIKADINPWRKLGLEVQTVHCFVFDENDSSPIGDGLPNVVRDSALSIAAATRMTLDNASVTCGPNLELTMSLLRQDQDLKSVEGYKIWYRNEDEDAATAAYPAVRPVQIDGHLKELEGLIKMFMEFADLETFVGPATGGDVTKAPSEPMRTAAGASMLRGDAALPFKDIVRNFDFFTQSVILSLVHFNKKFNPQFAPEGDYNVVARGATSLIAKEVRGMQLDMLAQTLTDEERDWIDEGKFVAQRFAVRDMTSLMVSPTEAKQKKEARQAAMGRMQEAQERHLEAEIRQLLAKAFKEITQGQKNQANADAEVANSALAILEHGMEDDSKPEGTGAATGG
jgi:hypothetical protein